MAARVRKGDRVVVTTGRDKGKTGEVLGVLPKEDRVLVRGVNMIKRHTRSTQTQAGGIIEREAPLHLSNVMLARSEEHTSELQSLMRISYAVFCLKKKKKAPQSIRTCE